MSGGKDLTCALQTRLGPHCSSCRAEQRAEARSTSSARTPSSRRRLSFGTSTRRCERISERLLGAGSADQDREGDAQRRSEFLGESDRTRVSCAISTVSVVHRTAEDLSRPMTSFKAASPSSAKSLWSSVSAVRERDPRSGDVVASGSRGTALSPLIAAQRLRLRANRGASRRMMSGPICSTSFALGKRQSRPGRDVP